MPTSSWKLLQLGAVPQCSKKSAGGYKAFCLLLRSWGLQHTRFKATGVLSGESFSTLSSVKQSRVDQDHAFVDWVPLGQNSFSKTFLNASLAQKNVVVPDP